MPLLGLSCMWQVLKKSTKISLDPAINYTHTHTQTHHMSSSACVGGGAACQHRLHFDSFVVSFDDELYIFYGFFFTSSIFVSECVSVIYILVCELAAL